MRFSCRPLCLLFVLLVASPALAKEPERIVANVEVAGQKDRAEVTILGSFAVPTYSVTPLDDGKKVVIEVNEAILDKDGFEVQGTAALIVRTTASTTASGVRLVLDLTRAATYRVRADRDQIKLWFESDATVGTTPAADEAADPAAPLQVQHVVIERRNGRERVVAELNRAATFRLVPGNKGPMRLEIRDAQLAQSVPAELRGDANSIVRRVTSKFEDGRVVLEVDQDQDTSATAIREGNRIVWMFSRRNESEASRGRTVTREASVEIDGEEVAAFLSDVPMQVGGIGANRKYSGRRIDLDFKDADIHNILRLLSEVGNVNVIVADDVSGTVTIKMRGVPWDQALDVILSAKSLGMTRRGNLIRVAPESVLEKEREMAIARQKQKVQLAPLETRLIPVSYGEAPEMSTKISELLSERGKVTVDSRTNIMIVRDVTENLDDIEELVRSLDSQTPQVLIEARIVEATTAFSTELGIQWGASMVMSSQTGNPTGLVFPSDMSIAGGATDGSAPTGGLSPFARSVPNPNYVVNLPAPAGTGQGAAVGMSMGSLGGNFNLALRLSAFESTGDVRIISSPRILTLDNQQAQIAQGTSIPYSQVSAQGVNTAFQEAKLQLQVTPHVTSDGAVAMDVQITRDEPDFNQTSARGDPTILKRQAKTHLLVQDGHTAVIGGIYTRNTGHGLEQVPFFGDIPILGVLFKHTSYRDARQELLIFLTPRIVNRAEALNR
jgi:type IV pilus assembly protein PilQ